MVIWHKGGNCVEVFKKLRQYYWPYKNYFIFSMVFLLIVTGLTVVYPVILQQTIDKVIYKGQYDLIPTLTLGFLGIMVIKGIATYIQQYTGDLFGIKSVYRMRNALYEKLQFLPFSYYDNAKTGDLMSRLTADVETFRFFLSMGFSELFRFILMLSVAFGVMFFYSVPLTLATMVSLPFLLFVVYKFDRSVHPAFRGIRKSFGRLNTNVQENISGINTVKSLSREEFQNGKFNVSNTDYKDQMIFTSGIWAKYFPLMEFLGNLCVVVMLSFGGYLVINGSLTPGELVAFYSLVGFVLWPIMSLGFTINMFSQSKASGERLLEVLEVKEEIQEKEDAYAPERLLGEVEFKNVSLRYAGDDNEALQDINFKAEPGKIIGLLGA